MIPEAELARALARWKERKLGTAAAHPGGVDVDAGAHVELDGQEFEESTRVAASQYAEADAAGAEVQLADGDFEDHTRRR